MTMLPTSTSKGWSIANAIPRAIDPGAMATSATRFCSASLVAASGGAAEKSVAIMPGETGISTDSAGIDDAGASDTPSWLDMDKCGNRRNVRRLAYGTTELRFAFTGQDQFGDRGIDRGAVAVSAALALGAAHLIGPRR